MKPGCWWWQIQEHSALGEHCKNQYGARGGNSGLNLYEFEYVLHLFRSLLSFHRWALAAFAVSYLCLCLHVPVCAYLYFCHSVINPFGEQQGKCTYCGSGGCDRAFPNTSLPPAGMKVNWCLWTLNCWSSFCSLLLPPSLIFAQLLFSSHCPCHLSVFPLCEAPTPLHYERL